ncbi:cytochrome c [Alcaligenaceae bacterium]|nr:cytochrome c [Alcaligenaceae bacterium]
MSRFVLRGLLGLSLWSAAGLALAAGPDPAMLEKGKAIFMKDAVPACAICHALQDAGSAGSIGPDLDELKPDLERVKKVLVEGAGTMPSFAESLDEASREAVAAYVVHATGGQ